MSSFHLPTRPYSPIDCLNRRSAAQGSMRYAQAATHADYNGHSVSLRWNSYRGYYIAEYFWGERVVLCRGSFADCLAAVLYEYNRGALGSSASVNPRPDDADAIALCEATKGLIKGARPQQESWWTWRHTVAGQCARDYCHPGKMTMIFDWDVMQSVSDEESYYQAVKAKHGRAYC
jgi:hypothetical protein